MTSIAYSPVSIQTSSQAAPLPPPWFGQVVLIVAHLRKQGVLDAITQRVRFARRRFGRYEVIDFVAVLFRYAISRESNPGSFFSDWTFRCPAHPTPVAGEQRREADGSLRGVDSASIR